MYSYELAERAEALGIITSVVGAYDIVPRISWRALSYLKLLVSKALDETSIKKVCIQSLHTPTLSISFSATFFLNQYSQKKRSTIVPFRFGNGSIRLPFLAAVPCHSVSFRFHSCTPNRCKTVAELSSFGALEEGGDVHTVL